MSASRQKRTLLARPIPSALRRAWIPAGLAIYWRPPEEVLNARPLPKAGSMMFLTALAFRHRDDLGWAVNWAWLDNGRLTLSFLNSGTPQMIVVRLIRAVSVVIRRRPQARTTKPIVHMRCGFGLPRLFQGRVANRSDS